MDNKQIPPTKPPAGRPFSPRGGSRGPRGGRSLFDKPVPTRTQPRPLGANFKTTQSLKQGFAKEETHAGPSDKHEVKRGGSGPKRGRSGGAFEAMPRMSTYKNKPQLKTGTDTDLLEQGSDRFKVVVLGGNE